MEGTEYEAVDMQEHAEELVETEAPRKRYELDDRGFDEVPKKYRRFYRRWEGPEDELAPNEALCLSLIHI